MYLVTTKSNNIVATGGKAINIKKVMTRFECTIFEHKPFVCHDDLTYQDNVRKL